MGLLQNYRIRKIERMLDKGLSDDDFSEIIRRIKTKIGNQEYRDTLMLKVLKLQTSNNLLNDIAGYFASSVSITHFEAFGESPTTSYYMPFATEHFYQLLLKQHEVGSEDSRYLFYHLIEQTCHKSMFAKLISDTYAQWSVNDNKDFPLYILQLFEHFFYMWGEKYITQPNIDVIKKIVEDNITNTDLLKYFLEKFYRKEFKNIVIELIVEALKNEELIFSRIKAEVVNALCYILDYDFTDTEIKLIDSIVLEHPNLLESNELASKIAQLTNNPDVLSLIIKHKTTELNHRLLIEVIYNQNVSEEILENIFHLVSSPNLKIAELSTEAYESIINALIHKTSDTELLEKIFSDICLSHKPFLINLAKKLSFESQADLFRRTFWELNNLPELQEEAFKIFQDKTKDMPEDKRLLLAFECNLVAKYEAEFFNEGPEVKSLPGLDLGIKLLAHLYAMHILSGQYQAGKIPSYCSEANFPSVTAEAETIVNELVTLNTVDL